MTEPITENAHQLCDNSVMRTHRLHVGSFTRSVVLEVARRDGTLAKARIQVVESLVATSPAEPAADARAEVSKRASTTSSSPAPTTSSRTGSSRAIPCGATYECR